MERVIHVRVVVLEKNAIYLNTTKSWINAHVVSVSLRLCVLKHVKILMTLYRTKTTGGEMKTEKLNMDDPCKGCAIKESCEHRDRASTCPCIKCLVKTSCSIDCNDFDLFFVGRTADD